MLATLRRSDTVQGNGNRRLSGERTMMENYSKHQQGIIKRFYENYDKIQFQKLSELVTELFLAEGKKKDKLWTQTETLMLKLNVPPTRVDHICKTRDVTLLAKLVKEFSAG
jgi:hypothetical protein